MADQGQQGQQAPYNVNPLNNNNMPSLSDEKMIPQVDGGIPMDSRGISQGQYDAMQPVPNTEIVFEKGNYKQVFGLPKVVTDKVAELCQTFVPLIEVSLVELLGASNMYRRALGQCIPAFDNEGKISIQFTFQYIVDKFIGQDIPLESIQSDSNYILERIKVAKANITKCEIDVGSGEITIQGTI